MISLLPLAVVIPLGVAFLLPLLGKLSTGIRLCRVLSLVSSLALLAMAVCFLVIKAKGSYWMGGWEPSSGAVGISLELDGLSRLMLTVVALVTFTATLFSLRYMTQYSSGN